MSVHVTSLPSPQWPAVASQPKPVAGSPTYYALEDIGAHLAGLERWYGTRVNGDCMSPDIRDGDVAVFDKDAWPGRGDIAAIYIGGKVDGVPVVAPWVKRITLPMWEAKLPLQLGQGSDCVPLVSFASNIEGQRWTLQGTQIYALHKYIGKKDDLVWDGNLWVPKPKGARRGPSDRQWQGRPPGGLRQCLTPFPAARSWPDLQPRRRPL